MEDVLKDVIRQLEHQQEAVEKALTALRGLEEAGGAGSRAAESVTTAPGSPAKRKGGMSPEGKRRLIAALKKRWAAKRAAESSTPVTPAPATKTSERTKPRFTAEGRQRLTEAMKRRWAAKRTAAQAKKKSGRSRKAA